MNALLGPMGGVVNRAFKGLESCIRWNIWLRGKPGAGTKEATVVYAVIIIVDFNPPARLFFIPISCCNTGVPHDVGVNVPDSNDMLKIGDKLVPVRKPLFPLPIRPRIGVTVGILGNFGINPGAWIAIPVPRERCQQSEKLTSPRGMKNH
jgi:hypothetical protein